MKFVAPLSDPELQTLNAMQRFHPSRRARMRAHSILLSHQGFAIKRIAAVSQVSRQAVCACLECWQTAGLAGLYDHPRSGRPPCLSAAEQQQVAHYVQEHPRALKWVVQRLEQEMHKRVSTKTLKRLLKKNARCGNG